VTIDGNRFQHSWQDAQTGEAAVFTVRNQSGGAPWSSVDSVTFTNNLIAHVGGGLAILGHDPNYPSQAAHDFTVENNLFYDVGGATWGGYGRMALLDSGTSDPGPSNVTLAHNTSVQSGDPLVAGAPQAMVPHPGLSFRDNLVENGSGGVWGPGTPQGDPTLAGYYAGAIFTGNAIVGAAASAYPAHPANQFPGVVEFADPASGNFALSPASPLHGTASDGSDPGFDPAPLAFAASCRR
jgi:hypothetical protein